MVNVRYQLAGAVWTMAFAVPSALLALAVFALFDRYTMEIGQALAAIFEADWRAFVSIRWPEAVGMLVGMALLLATLLFARGQNLTRKPDLS